MKNSNFIFVLIVAAAAGYFAYPYFNPGKSGVKDAIEITKKLEKGDSQSRSKVADKDKENIDPHKMAPDVFSENQDKSQVNPDEEELGRNTHSNNHQEGQSEKALNESDRTSFFAGSNRPVVNRDFSTYTLKTKNQIGVSKQDPRLVLIRGFYQGNFEGNAVDLEIGASESSIRFSDNDSLSFGSDNDQFFTNVNEAGNRFLLRNGETKLYLEITNWPRLKLHMGLKTQIILEKTR